MKGKISLGILALAISGILGSLWHGGVQAQTTQHGVTVSWAAGVPATGQAADTSYNVYRSTVSGGPYTKLTATPVTTLFYFDGSGVGGTKYFYVVTGLAPGATESAFSNEASAVFLAQAATPGSVGAAAN